MIFIQKTSKQTRKIPEGDPNYDWFFIENRLRKLVYDLYEPLNNKQTRHEHQIANLISRLDTTNYTIDGLLYEIQQAKDAVKQVDYMKKDIKELERKVFVCEERQIAQFNDISSKFFTVNEKVKSNENQLRINQGAVNMFNQEIKNISSIVSDQRDNISRIFNKAIEDFDYKAS